MKGHDDGVQLRERKDEIKWLF